jgi:hypothetical protein
MQLFLYKMSTIKSCRSAYCNIKHDARMLILLSYTVYAIQSKNVHGMSHLDQNHGNVATSKIYWNNTNWKQRVLTQHRIGDHALQNCI